MSYQQLNSRGVSFFSARWNCILPLLAVLILGAPRFAFSEEPSALERDLNEAVSQIQTAKNREPTARAALDQSEIALKHAKELHDAASEDVASRAVTTAKIALSKTQAAKRQGEDKLRAVCERAEAQLTQDKEALRRQQKVMEATTKELEEWAAQSEEAQRDAVMTGVNLLTDGVLGHFAESGRAVNGLKGAIAKQENELKRAGKAIDLKDKKANIEKLTEKLHGMQSRMETAKSLQNKKGNIELFWGEFTATTRGVDDEAASFQQEWTALTEDPILKGLLEKEGLMPIAGKIKDWKLFPKKPYLINFADFIVDYGYDATKWTAARNRILQQNNLTDKELEAVDTLKKQIERTTAVLAKCRQYLAARQGAD